MARLTGGLLCALMFALILHPVQAEEVELQVEWSEALLAADIPADLTQPEGKMRWELADLKAGARWIRTLSFTDGTSEIESLDVSLDKRAPEMRYLLFTDPHKRSAAERWALPHKDDGLLDVAGALIELQRSTGDKSERLWIETRRVGIGWIFLPSRPFEVVLQRALVHRWTPGAGYTPDTLIHRWIDPRAGVVAEVWGPATNDGKERILVEGARFVDKVVQGGTPFKLYVDEFDLPTFTRFVYGYDLGDDPMMPTLVSDLTPDNHLEIADLLAASSWDFSANVEANSVGEFVSSNVDINAQETCWASECGFSLTGGGALGPNKLGREDRTEFATSELTFTSSAQQRETRVGDTTIWLRAVQRDAGLDGQTTRLCFSDDATDRTEVPLYRFLNQDADGWFMQHLPAQNGDIGDSWTHTPFDCEPTIFPQDCGGGCGFGCPIYTAPCSDKTGTVFGSAVAEGPVTLPSGHTFSSLVINTTNDYCAFLDGSCIVGVNQIKTVVYLWAVPNLGSITRVQSRQAAFTTTDWTQGADDIVGETDFKYGLFPPRAMSVDNVSDSSVTISWAPGLITNRLTGYVVYYDTDSGGDSDYANSMVIGSSATTSATIGGLASSTEYFFTVTSTAEYQHESDPPATPTQYESLKYPTTVVGGASPVPMEVMATTTGPSCVPTTEVTGVTVGRSGRDSIEMCWDLVSDPCLEGYQIIGADTPESDANFSVVVADTGLTTCHTFNPTQTHLLVLAASPAGTGPWGHFGR